jgi:hypothetical protein
MRIYHEPSILAPQAKLRTALNIRIETQYSAQMNPKEENTHWNDHSANDGQVAILWSIVLLELLVCDKDELAYGMQDATHEINRLLDDSDACFLDGITRNRVYAFYSVRLVSRQEEAGRECGHLLDMRYLLVGNGFSYCISEDS